MVKPVPQGKRLGKGHVGQSLCFCSFLPSRIQVHGMALSRALYRNKTDKGMEFWKRYLKARGLLDTTGKFLADRRVTGDQQRSAHLHWPGPTTSTTKGSWSCARPVFLKTVETLQRLRLYFEEMQGSQCYGHVWLQDSVFYIKGSVMVK